MMVESLDTVQKLLIRYSRSASIFATLQRARYYDEKTAEEIARGTSHGEQLLHAITEALNTIRTVNRGLLLQLKKQTVVSQLAAIAENHNDLDLTAERLQEAVTEVFPLINAGQTQQDISVYETILKRISKLKEVSSYMVL